MQFYRHLSHIGCSLLIGSTGLAAAEDFSFEILCAKARQLAAAPSAQPTLELADYWKNLTYDQHRDMI